MFSETVSTLCVERLVYRIERVFIVERAHLGRLFLRKNHSVGVKNAANSFTSRNLIHCFPDALYCKRIGEDERYSPASASRAGVSTRNLVVLIISHDCMGKSFVPAGFFIAEAFRGLVSLRN